MTTWMLLWAAAWARPECDRDGGPGCLQRARIAQTLDRPRRAQRLRRRACTAAHPESCGPLRQTDEAAVDAVLAEAATACEAGALPACRHLGLWHLEGPREVRSFAAAERWLGYACDQHDAGGCVRLARHLQTSGPDHVANPAVARRRLEQACTLGSAVGCHDVAWMQIRGTGGPVDVDAARESLRTACDDRSARACEGLGRWHLDGTGAPPDPAAAASAFARSCEADPERCADLTEALLDEASDVTALVEAMPRVCDDEASAEPCAAVLMLEIAGGAELVADLGDDLLDEAREVACQHGHLPSCPDEAEPPIPRQVELYRAERRRLDAMRRPWPPVDGPAPELPDAAWLEDCVARTVERLADPELLGRGTPSPGYTDAADLVAEAFGRQGLSVRRPEVLAPAAAPSWIRVGDARFRALAVDGTAAGAFRGPARVLPRAPTPADLADLDGVAAVLYEAPRLEPAAARRFVRAPVPVLAVTPDAARAARAAPAIEGVASPSRRGDVVENVLGTLAGRGALADEVVVLGAHLDAQGSDLDGRVRPGADDNASGIAGLVCAADLLARQLAGADHRAVVFAAFGGEERGLFGSRTHAWTEPPPVAMLNLDMIGRLGDRPLEVRAYGEDWPQILGPAARALGVELYDGDVEGLSDHLPFALAGAPAAALHTGAHGDYHRETDTADRVDVPGTARVVALATAAMAHLATGPAPGPPTEPCTELAHDVLGVGWALHIFGSGRWQVRCVRPGSLGEALGVRIGDQVLDFELGGWPTEPASILVARGATCLELGVDEAPTPRRCESAP